MGEQEYTEQSLVNTVPNIEQLQGCNQAIIILQSGVTESYKEGEGKLPYVARMRAFGGILAYYQALENGDEPVMIFSGGATIKGIEENEATLMKRFIVENYGINPLRVIAEDKSLDTSTNAIYCSKILNELHFPKKSNANVKVITSEFHLRRSKRVFDKYYGDTFDVICAEEILIRAGERYCLPGDSHPLPYGKFAKHFSESGYNRYLRSKDMLISFISNLPQGEELLRKITSITRDNR